MFNSGKILGYVYQDGCGSVCFQVGPLCLSFLASGILKEILGVTKFDEFGFVEVATNYGLEFFDFEEALEDLGLLDGLDLAGLMNSISGWKVLNKEDVVVGKKEVSVIVDRAFLVMNGLAFDMALRGSVRLLRVVDLRNLEHKAELSYNSVHQFFSIVNSSFPDSKRKYEMLFLVERNTQMLKEALDRA